MRAAPSTAADPAPPASDVAGALAFLRRALRAERRLCVFRHHGSGAGEARAVCRDVLRSIAARRGDRPAWGRPDESTMDCAIGDWRARVTVGEDFVLLTLRLPFWDWLTRGGPLGGAIAGALDARLLPPPW